MYTLLKIIYARRAHFIMVLPRVSQIHDTCSRGSIITVHPQNNDTSIPVVHTHTRESAYIMKGTVTAAAYTLAILLSMWNGDAAAAGRRLCNPFTDRHCQPFPEQNVESITVIRTYRVHI
jgi:hypothetical protein